MDMHRMCHFTSHCLYQKQSIDGGMTLPNFQTLPESQRDDAVSSMIYEASTRIRDPVYGCAGAISQLQTQITQLQAQLAESQAELVSMQIQRANLMEQLHMTRYLESSPTQSIESLVNSPYDCQINWCLDDYNAFGSFWEPLWT